MSKEKTTLMIFGVLCLAAFFSVTYFFAQKKSDSISSESTISNKEQLQKKAAILFVGDIMLDRHIREASEKRGKDFILEGVSDFLKQNDLVVGNLEGPITQNSSKSVGTEMGSKENYVFTFDPAFAPVLGANNIGLLNLGNNHIYNFGQAGLNETKKNLSGAGLGYFGDPSDTNNDAVEKNINGTTIAFVSWDQFNAKDPERIVKKISEAKSKNDFVFVYTHWGVEYDKSPTEKVRSLAHQFVDAGADLVIGSHSHIVGEKEIYKEKTIYYSLGNFIFDQYFNPQTQEGLMIRVIIGGTDKKMEINEKKIQLKTTGQTVLE